MQICPECYSETAVLLTHLSRTSPLNHYTCSACVCEWTVSKQFEVDDDEGVDVEPDEAVH